jgi:uncharacterized protein
MAGEAQARIAVRVQANAAQSKVTGFKDGILQVRVTSPPLEGKANQELVRFLADVLGVSKSNLTIEKGLTSRNKLVSVKGLGQDEVLKRLEMQQIQTKAYVS